MVCRDVPCQMTRGRGVSSLSSRVLRLAGPASEMGSRAARLQMIRSAFERAMFGLVVQMCCMS